MPFSAYVEVIQTQKKLSQNKQKPSQQSYKTEIKIVANSGIA